MAGAFLTDDLSNMFLTTDFADTATFNGVSINVIIDREYFEQTADGQVGVESSKPIAHCISSDVESATAGDIMQVGTQRYRVAGIEPSNTGTTLLILSVTSADKNYGSVAAETTQSFDYGLVTATASTSEDYGSVAA